MLVVLEGPDGAGKTALATALAERWADDGRNASRVIHVGPPDDPSRCPFDEYELIFDREPLLSEVWDHRTLVIFDRLHAGDPVYGPKYRGFSRLSPEGSLHVELTLQSLGAARAMCLPHLHVIRERVERDGDWYIDQADLPRIHAEYAAYGERYNWRFTGHDPRDASSWSEVTTRRLIIEARILGHLARGLRDASAGTYTGHPSPRAIFVGEQVGASRLTRPEITRPFTPITKSGSSNHLLTALLMGDRDIFNRCGLVNAYHPGVDLDRMAAAAPDAQWVALGVKASVALDDVKIPHARVWHPQFARRFRHGDISGYAAALSRAVTSQEPEAGSASTAGPERVDVV